MGGGSGRGHAAPSQGTESRQTAGGRKSPERPGWGGGQALPVLRAEVGGQVLVLASIPGVFGPSSACSKYGASTFIFQILTEPTAAPVVTESRVV